MALGLPRPSPAVKVLLILNVAMFLVQTLVRSGWPIERYLGVTVGAYWQVWRYVTFQFLHGGWWHIAMNMLGLYLLGTPLERHFGTRRFTWFYLSCGIVAGLSYVLLGWMTDLPSNYPIIGASGGVFGIILACAVYFPSFQIIFLFFPVPIRLAAIIIFGGMLFVVLQGMASHNTSEAMSDVAHLGGAGMAAFWIWGLPRVAARFGAARQRRQRGTWNRKLHEQQALQVQIDAVLHKIHTQGLTSLSGKEKKLLKEATRRQKEEDRRMNRM